MKAVLFYLGICCALALLSLLFKIEPQWKGMMVIALLLGANFWMLYKVCK